MKILRKILIVFVLVFVLVCFIVYWIEPKFSLYQMDKSIFLSYQDLPLQLMFGLPKEDGKFLVDSVEPQFVLSGPNLTLFPGVYSYNLEIMPNCTGEDLGFMDITRKNGRQGLGAKEIFALEKDKTQTESMEFEAGMGFDYEFRLYSKGACSFEIKRIFLEKKKTNYQILIQRIWQKVQKVLQ